MKSSRKGREVRAPAHCALVRAWRDGRESEPDAYEAEISRTISAETDPKHQSLTERRMLTSLLTAVLALTWLGPPIGAGQTPSSAPTGWQLVVLGIAQDAGIPQLGCNESPCKDIREGRRKPERVASLGLVNESLGLSYLFDATPDLPAQVRAFVNN